MAPTPPHDANAKSTSKAADASSSLQAEYEAAMTAYKDHLKVMGPTRVKYDELFHKHEKIQARTDKLMAKLTTQRSTYQRHKQYVISLSNALLASNAALRAAPLPFSDVQVLTHATIFHELRFASITLTDMMMKNKRLDNKKDKSFTLDQGFYARCREMFHVVDNDCLELDRLHAKVLELGEKMGKKPECGSVEKNCLSCTRNAEREYRRVVAAAEKGNDGGGSGKVKGEMGKAAAGKDNEGGGSGKVKDGMGKAAKGKQRLEDILEEVELKNAADA